MSGGVAVLILAGLAIGKGAAAALSSSPSVLMLSGFTPGPPLFVARRAILHAPLLSPCNPSRRSLARRSEPFLALSLSTIKVNRINVLNLCVHSFLKPVQSHIGFFFLRIPWRESMFFGDGWAVWVFVWCCCGCRGLRHAASL